MNKKYLSLLSIPLFAAVLLSLTAFSYQSETIQVSLSDSVSTSENLTPIIDKPVLQYISQIALKGHVLAVVTDKDGNVKQVTESDNITVNNGENCIAKLLFGTTGGDTSGTTVCTSTLDSGFRYIALEEGATAVAADDIELEDPADSAGLSTPLFATVAWTNSTGTGAGSDVTVVLTAAFTNTGATETITGGGLFNATATTTRSMYAHTLFADSAVVANTDTITLTWTLGIGEGTID